MKRYIEQLLEDEKELNEIISRPEEPEAFPDFMDGLFNDDGTRIEPESISLPCLCVICKMYQDDDPEENLLCLVNRFDQRNDDDFKCGMFEKI